MDIIERTIVFFRNTDMPDHYLLYGGPDAKVRLLEITNSPPYENSFLPKISNIEIGYIFKVKLKKPKKIYVYDEKFKNDFFDFLINEVSTHHIPPPYCQYYCNNYVYNGWYEFKTYEPDKWIKDFYDYYDAKMEEECLESQRQMEQNSRQENVQQLSLF
jgi:hypothetical protein